MLQRRGRPKINRKLASLNVSNYFLFNARYYYFQRFVSSMKHTHGQVNLDNTLCEHTPCVARTPKTLSLLKEKQKLFLQQYLGET